MGLINFTLLEFLILMGSELFLKYLTMWHQFIFPLILMHHPTWIPLGSKLLVTSWGLLSGYITFSLCSTHSCLIGRELLLFRCYCQTNWFLSINYWQESAVQERKSTLHVWGRRDGINILMSIKWEYSFILWLLPGFQCKRGEGLVCKSPADSICINEIGKMVTILGI